jgi:hypothetical protein
MSTSVILICGKFRGLFKTGSLKISQPEKLLKLKGR